MLAEAEDCTCFEPIRNGEPFMLMACGHKMHTDCMEKMCETKGWSFDKLKCPFCRAWSPASPGAFPEVAHARSEAAPETFSTFLESTGAGTARVESAEQFTPASLPATQGAASEVGPTQIDADDVFGYQVKACTFAQHEESDDPALAAIEAVRNATTVQEFQAALFPKDLFVGFKREDEIYTSIHKSLDRIHSDQRSHRELATRYDFVTSFVSPKPFLKAAEAICLKDGLHTESFLLCLDSNVTWLEHHRSRLGSEAPPPGVSVIAPEDDKHDGVVDVEDLGPSQEKPKRGSKRRAESRTGVASGGAQESRKGRKAQSSALEVAPAPVADGPHELPERVRIIVQGCDPSTDSVDTVIRKVEQDRGSAMQADEKRRVQALVVEMMNEMVVVPAPVPTDGQSSEGSAGLSLTLKSVVRIHSISPNKAVMFAGSASSRKSRLHDLSTDFITKSAYAPQELVKGTAYISEATLRGARLCFMKSNRGSMSSDEVINVMVTPWSDCQSSTNFIPRSKLCTYTQAERDDVVTGTGPIHLRNYSFQMKIGGQLEGIEWVLRMTPQAFFKRVALAVSPERNPWDDTVVDSVSLGWWQGLHDWMLKGPYLCPSYLHCDGTTRTYLRITLKAINEWLLEKNAKGDAVSRWFSIKVGFAFSDILRNALCIMRQVQFAESMSKNLRFAPNRLDIHPTEFMTGLHKYFRELELHAGYYRFMTEKESSSGLDGDIKKASALVEKITQSKPVAHDAESLNLGHMLKRVLLVTGKGFPLGFTSSDIRNKIRDKSPWRKMKDLADQLSTAAVSLEEAGLLIDVTEAAAARGNGPRRGMSVYKVATWAKVESGEVSLKLTGDLKLNRDAFF